MLKMKLSEIAALFGQKPDFEAEINKVVTDSRKADDRSLFVAIKGDNFDGNEFAAKALENGAVAVLVSRVCDGVDPDKTIVVEDTKRALIKIGGLYRNRFDIPFVGITGSVGKTTTKEFTAAVLAEKYNVHKNQGNQNNEIGVPNTMFALKDEHEICVVEMGMSGLGEIHDLAVEVKPCAAIITSVGVAHIQYLGSRENILKAKMEITDGMPDGAPLFICGDNDLLNDVTDERLKVYRFGIVNPDCDIRASSIEQQGTWTKFVITSPWGEYSAAIPLVGSHNVLDALAAFSLGCSMGVEPDKAAQALSKYVAVGMRQNAFAHNGMTIVGDCYNCSPDSLKASVLSLSSYPCEGRRILVLADMLELGPDAGKMHFECGEFIAKHNIDLLIGWGELTKQTIRGADSAGMERCCHYETKQEMAQQVMKAIRPKDVVWFKASLGMALDEVVEMVLGKEEKK